MFLNKLCNLPFGADVRVRVRVRVRVSCFVSSSSSLSNQSTLLPNFFQHGLKPADHV